MSLTELWRNMRDKMATQKSAPASELLPRMRDSAKLRALSQPPASEPTPAAVSSLGDVTPFANDIASMPATDIPPPAWQDVFPAHHRALVADLTKRGENMANWEIQDGRDMGVSDSGHTVAFNLHKTDTSVTIQVELTMFKGHLASVRVR